MNRHLNFQHRMSRNEEEKQTTGSFLLYVIERSERIEKSIFYSAYIFLSSLVINYIYLVRLVVSLLENGSIDSRDLEQ